VTERKLSCTPFKTCTKGHETKYEDQFIYDNQKKMICRKCAEYKKTSKRKK
jgi:hypothetical protein